MRVSFLKTIGYFILIVVLLFILSGCNATASLTNADILSRLPSSLAEYTIQDIQYTANNPTLKIEKRATENNSTEIYAYFIIDDENIHVETYLNLNFEYWDQGEWQLEDCNIISQTAVAKTAPQADLISTVLKNDWQYDYLKYYTPLAFIHTTKQSDQVYSLTYSMEYSGVYLQRNGTLDVLVSFESTADSDGRCVCKWQLTSVTPAYDDSWNLTGSYSGTMKGWYGDESLYDLNVSVLSANDNSAVLTGSFYYNQEKLVDEWTNETYAIRWVESDLPSTGMCIISFSFGYNDYTLSFSADKCEGTYANYHTVLDKNPW